MSTDLDTLAGLLDEWEAAQDEITVAFQRKRRVKDRVKAALGIEKPCISDDQLSGHLLRALVKARGAERRGGSS